MGTTLNRHAYQRLIDEDLEWLRKQPRSLERDHVEGIVQRSLMHEYSAIDREFANQQTAGERCVDCGHEDGRDEDGICQFQVPIRTPKARHHRETRSCGCHCVFQSTPKESEETFADYLPLEAVRAAPGEYDIKTRDGQTLWRMEGAALADWACASINGYDAAVNGLKGADQDVEISRRLRQLLKAGFIIGHSHGPSADYQVQLKFRSLTESSHAHTLIEALVNPGYRESFIKQGVLAPFSNSMPAAANTESVQSSGERIVKNKTPDLKNNSQM